MNKKSRLDVRDEGTIQERFGQLPWEFLIFITICLVMTMYLQQ